MLEERVIDFGHVDVKSVTTVFVGILVVVIDRVWQMIYTPTYIYVLFRHYLVVTINSIITNS